MHTQSLQPLPHVVVVETNSSILFTILLMATVFTLSTWSCLKYPLAFNSPVFSFNMFIKVYNWLQDSLELPVTSKLLPLLSGNAELNPGPSPLEAIHFCHLNLYTLQYKSYCLKKWHLGSSGGWMCLLSVKLGSYCMMHFLSNRT